MGLAALLSAGGCRDRNGDNPDTYRGPLLRMAIGTGVIGRPSTAVRDDHVAVAWFGLAGADTVVFVARSLDGGQSFSAELRASPVGEPTPADLSNGPRVELILDPDGFAQPFVAWSRSGGGSTAIVWTYTKDGTAFSAPAVVPGSVTNLRQRLVALARDSSDRTFALWTQGSAPALETEVTCVAATAAVAGRLAVAVPCRTGDTESAINARINTVRGVANSSTGRTGVAWIAPPSAGDRADAADAGSGGGGGTMLHWTKSDSGPSFTMPEPGSHPILAAPASAAVLLWVSHRTTGREINVVRVP